VPPVLPAASTAACMAAVSLDFPSPLAPNWSMLKMAALVAVCSGALAEISVGWATQASPGASAAADRRKKSFLLKVWYHLSERLSR